MMGLPDARDIAAAEHTDENASITRSFILASTDRNHQVARKAFWLKQVGIGLV